MNRAAESMQARLETVAREVGLTWEHVQHMTFRRFALLGDTPTLHGMGERR